MPTPATAATTAVPPAREAAPAGLGEHAGKHPGEPDLMDPELLADPFGGYGRLREQGPIVRGRRPDGAPVWLVTRHDDVRELLRDQRFVTSPASVPGRPAGSSGCAGAPERTPAEPGRPRLPGSLPDTDPPARTRLRRPAARAFSAHRLQALRPRVERIADQLLDALPGYAVDGAVDLVEHYAYPLSIGVLGALVGLPEADRGLWRGWSAEHAAGRADAATEALAGRLRELAARRRAEPADDLVGALLRPDEAAVRGAVGGPCGGVGGAVVDGPCGGVGGAVVDGPCGGVSGDGRITDEEVAGLVLALVAAGHAPTADLIGNGAAALLTHPGERARLDADPALWPRAVEELVRWCGPVQLTGPRWATEDLTFRDTRIRRGEAVQLVLVAANFDPRRHPHPERLDLTREPAGPGEQQVGFGHGIHSCPGAGLARQEAEVALAALLRRHPGLTLAVAPEQLERVPLPEGWRLRRLPVRLERAG
ncbi:cytochrome P450 [Kitasatospora herbaricolor]|uniref:cytochrome P450 n=1 Tax=Kitasatospora herbaricolor TaxID=68217 RepID=UPI00199A5D87|nr:cytochrome P450 [Kitasatospora herbaricolor]MDQ0309765.1 cytochrome P450 [Kitasatospora herbaricolor]GGU99747.1 cytochrome P450 [Kitasatospora herbaricolor]